MEKRRDVPQYLLDAMQAAVSSDAFSDGHVSTIARLTGEKLRGHRFAWPPAEEQRATVEHIDGEAAASDASIERARTEIDLLRELRTRLTSDVVTGQVDVQPIAATLPELDPAEVVADVSAAEDDLDDEAAEVLEDVDA